MTIMWLIELAAWSNIDFGIYFFLIPTGWNNQAGDQSDVKAGQFWPCVQWIHWGIWLWYAHICKCQNPFPPIFRLIKHTRMAIQITQCAQASMQATWPQLKMKSHQSVTCVIGGSSEVATSPLRQKSTSLSMLWVLFLFDNFPVYIWMVHGNLFRSLDSFFEFMMSLSSRACLGHLGSKANSTYLSSLAYICVHRKATFFFAVSSQNYWVAFLQIMSIEIKHSNYFYLCRNTVSFDDARGVWAPWAAKATKGGEESGNLQILRTKSAANYTNSSVKTYKNCGTSPVTWVFVQSL